MPRTRLALLVVLLCPAVAHAHFKLNAPANWTAQITDGTPQKMPPCGNEGSPADTGPLTEYKMGDTITISIDETVPHPGHYRVSLAADQASLPADPSAQVMPIGGKTCDSLPINPAPTLPLIADGLLVHTDLNRRGPQTMQVKLPDGMLCDHCVLQVVEFMGNHGTPCFYHHCANIKISATGPTGGTGSGSMTGGGGTGGGGEDAGVGSSPGGVSSSGCAVGGQDVAGAALLALTLGFVITRRRRA